MKADSKVELFIPVTEREEWQQVCGSCSFSENKLLHLIVHFLPYAGALWV